MTTLTIDLDNDSDDELNAAAAACREEVSRRETVRRAEETVNYVNQQVLATEGLATGDAWRQPLGGHDAYPHDWIVEHNGKLWRSLVSANVWEPGASGWREESASGAPPEWVQPTGGHDAYKIGDLVTFFGKVYRSLIDGNAWSPLVHPPGWEVVQ